ncbi:MAG: hypothetical protein ABEL76_05540 [Bradymonadaceae bacterium]
MRDSFKQFFLELALWIAASLACTGVALGSTWVLLQLIGSGGPVLTTALFAVPVALTVTWGAWISLNWTRHRLLRGAMKGLTLLPGTVLLIIGGVGVYVGLASKLACIAWLASSVGTLAAAVLLWRSIPRTSATRSSAGLVAGFTLYPLLTSATSAAVGYLWFWFATRPAWDDITLSFALLRTVFLTVLAAELITTALPALFSALCGGAVEASAERFGE